MTTQNENIKFVVVYVDGGPMIMRAETAEEANEIFNEITNAIESGGATWVRTRNPNPNPNPDPEEVVHSQVMICLERVSHLAIYESISDVLVASAVWFGNAFPAVGVVDGPAGNFDMDDDDDGEMDLLNDPDAWKRL